MSSIARPMKSVRVSRASAAARTGKTTPETANGIRHAPAAVVGVGASAGGLEALKGLFGTMPPDTGLVFVIVIHLDPTHDSLVPELLAKATALTVLQARDRQPLEVDHVYVIPPNRSLTIDQGLIRVKEVADRRGLRGSIDHFFRSLAADQHDNAVCIVLSGTGAEGAAGLQAIKDEGGLAIVQSPETASQPGMPSSAIATGRADFVLPPEKMPEVLLRYVRHTRPARAAAEARTAPLEGLPVVLDLLREKKRHDFRGYKKNTLSRRIARRMGLRQIETAAEYVEYLRSDPDEVDRLFTDLLIGVTSFFRDAEAFDELATRVLKPLVEECEAESSIRIWVPGCATGEEAYSLAILTAELISTARSGCRVQIYATDVYADALTIARAGAYPASIALDLTPQRLQRYFTREDHRYKVVKSIRDLVVFAEQNLLSDPPFSKLDLVSCRNVLIYLEPVVQARLLSLFHYALRPGGFLFLGNAGSVGAMEESFASISKHHRIFRRLGPARRPAPEVPVLSPEVRTGRADVQPAQEPALASLADRLLLDHFAPAAVVVSETGQILRFYGPMERYIRLPTGDATLNVLALARQPLTPTLRAALHDAVRRGRQTVFEAADFVRNRRRAHLRVTVRPLDQPRGAAHLWLMIFEELSPAALPAPAKKGRQPDIVRRLESQLRATRREQQHLVEQLETNNEELKAANDEILSMNEELQSTNEELVTSKEELQSMNEELTTLNAQLQDKVQEVTAANDDLGNLLVSTDIATVFIDTDFRIKRFTAAATSLLNLLPSDVGRPITHLATNLDNIDLTEDARTVLGTVTPIQKEVAARDGTQYFVRVLPYRTEGGKVQGVVLTLIDITALKRTERELRTARDELGQLNQNLEERVAQRTKWLTLMHDVTRVISEASSWDDALHLVLRHICESEKWQIGYVYLPDPDAPAQIRAAISCFGDERFQPFHLAAKDRRYARGQSLPGRVYAEGIPVWVNSQDELLALLLKRAEAVRQVGLRSAVALPIVVGREIIAVLELFSDRPHERSVELANLMTDVSTQIGRVLERERLTTQMAELVWREQQELLHTLHDSLGQTLTGLGMLSSALGRRLVGADAEAGETAQQIAQQAQRALQQVRQLANGLFPVEVDAEGLVPALRQLASTTESLHKVQVVVEGDGGSGLHDPRVATQLYRIVQEAVTNAVKHGQPRTIRIQVSEEPGLTKIIVADDGVGFRNSVPRTDGLGLRIMRYRAASIGAHLTISSEPGHGTIVTCTLREAPRTGASEPSSDDPSATSSPGENR